MDISESTLAFAIGLGIFALFALYVFMKCLCRPGTHLMLRKWHSDGVVVFKYDEESFNYQIHNCKSFMANISLLLFWKDFTCYSIPDAHVTWAGKGVTKTESCAICLKAFSLADKVLLLHCNHGFHGNCIMRWLMASSGHTCPLCSRTVKLLEISDNRIIDEKDANDLSELPADINS